jgi:hypothetical protein
MRRVARGSATTKLLGALFSTALLCRLALALPQDLPRTDAQGTLEKEKPQKDPQEKKDSRPSRPEDGNTQEVVITGRALDLTGVAQGASEGQIGQDQLKDRIMERTGEVLETIPGVIVTQHSGGGKANQYFTRGFNLDHGTDFATWVNGMPINMPTHAHGQGYMDLNWLIPELIQEVDYRKGPYYAQETDFSAAGAAHIEYAQSLKEGLAQVSLGTYGYARGLVIGSVRAMDGDLLYGLEAFHEDGPWANPDDYLRKNLVLGYSQGNANWGWNVTAMGYQGGPWNSTDQVADRAISDGTIGRFGAIDPTDGGKTYRYSLSGEWHSGDATGMTRAHAYVVGYGLNLWSNFTYFLNDPANGDQFEQVDRRITFGGDVSREWVTRFFGLEEQTTLGLQSRNDDISTLGLYHTKARTRLGTTSLDSVLENSVGLYVSEFVQILPWLRATLGLRGDFYHFDVTDHLVAENSGTLNRSLASPKGSVVLGPWSNTEFYVQAGEGYHSNDARGALTQVQETTLLPFQKVTPLVRASGADVGLRTGILPGLQSTLGFFYLHLDSELTFDGDTASSVPSAPTRRYGVEWANHYHPVSWVTLDADLAYTQARFTASDANGIPGQHVPEAVEGVAALGGSADLGWGFSTGVELRYFGPRALTQDNSVRSRSTTLLQGRLSYRYKNVTVALECLNMADAKASEIDYYYTSRLPGEPAAGVNDIHTHPVEPREFRVGLSIQF